MSLFGNVKHAVYTVLVMIASIAAGICTMMGVIDLLITTSLASGWYLTGLGLAALAAICFIVWFQEDYKTYKDLLNLCLFEYLFTVVIILMFVILP